MPKPRKHQRTTLAVYGIWAAPKHQISRPYDLDNVAKGLDLLQLIRTTLRARSGDFRDDSLELELSSVLVLKTGTRRCFGQMEAGHYGLPGKLVHRKTKAQRAKDRDEADARPYYFDFYLPAGRKRGLVAIQRIGGRGIYNALESLIKEIETANPTIKIHLDPLLLPGYLEKLAANALVRQVTFRQFNKPGDQSDSIGRGKGRGTAFTGTIEQTYKAKRDHNIDLDKPLLKRLLKLKPETADLSGLAMALGAQGNPESFTVVIDVNGKAHTIRLGDENPLARPYYEPDDLERDGDGFPTFDSLHAVVNDYILEATEYLDSDPDNAK